ncbi:MAG: hypothetical protein P1U32_07045 [Legionellaceae bacterium]|nr:hypothetical protein [Legionellaceae bacterium]
MVRKGLSSFWGEQNLQTNHILKKYGNEVYNLIIFCFISSYIISLRYFFPLYWDTNDDIFMSMIAHGYGLAEVGSPLLVFSNVIWGYLVRAIPDIYGFVGYSIATFVVLLMVGLAIFHSLRKIGPDLIISLLATSFVLLAPTVFPQFTINAGLCMVAFVLILQVINLEQDSIPYHWLFSAIFFACLGYLIRREEFFLILGVAAPFLPWKLLLKKKELRMMVIIIFVFIGGATFFDHISYSGEGWQHYFEVNSARISYTDYGAGALLENHPEILARHDYSPNDISLISNFFFADPSITTTSKLNALLNKLDYHFYGDASNLWRSVKAALSCLRILPLLLSAILLLVFYPSKKLCISWLIFILSFCLIGFLGRSFTVRIYIPIISLLFLFGVVNSYQYPSNFVRQNAKLICKGVILFFIICGFLITYLQAINRKKLIKDAQTRVIHFPHEVITMWGNFPVQYIYTPTTRNPSNFNLKIYGLDLSTLAPFSVAYHEELAQRGFVKKILSSGVLIVENNRHHLLKTWCREHFNGELEEKLINLSYNKKSPLASQFQIQRVRCIKGNDRDFSRGI